MKTTLVEAIKRVVDIKQVSINIPLRDGDVESDLDIPFIKDNVLRCVVDIDSGRIQTWPQGQTMKLCSKVCDEGIYKLFDTKGNCIASINEDYVPNNLIPGDYGDYVILDVDTDGLIKNWKPINLNEFFNRDGYART